MKPSVWIAWAMAAAAASGCVDQPEPELEDPEDPGEMSVEGVDGDTPYGWQCDDYAVNRVHWTDGAGSCGQCRSEVEAQANYYDCYLATGDSCCSLDTYSYDFSTPPGCSCGTTSRRWTQTVCGDGTCQSGEGEYCGSCPQDCGECCAGPASCSGVCGSSAPSCTCWCDPACDQFGDCCADKHNYCG